MTNSQETSVLAVSAPKLDSDADLGARPRRVGGVRLTKFIGIGAMGRVYRGWHETLGIDVAVKILIEGAASDQRFLSEANIAARILHDNVVRIHHAGKEGAESFLILELVDGVNLRDYMKKSGRLPWLRALDLTLQAARGLACAHRAGIVHRDLKPSNMMLSSKDVIKLMDFGLARDIAGDFSNAESRTVVGTPDYIAPEQAMDSRQVGPQADIYALGVCLFHMLTNEVPFKRSNYTNVLLAHIHDPIPDVREIVDEVPRPLARLIERMMSKHPADRPRDGEALVRELETMVESFESSTRFSSSVFAAAGHPLTRRLVRTGATASAVIVVPVICFFALSGNGMGRGVLADPTAVAQAAQRLKNPDPWQTPQRAVFLLPDKIPETLSSALNEAVSACGLTQVERRTLANLVQEQELVENHRVDVNSAIAIGNLIGGHIALIAVGQEQQVHLRAVVVESGEVVASKVAAVGEAPALVPGMVAAALARLPALGYLRVDPVTSAATVTLGARHGIAVGDEFDIFTGVPGNPGVAVATARALSVDAERCVVVLAGASSSITTGLAGKKQRITQ